MGKLKIKSLNDQVKDYLITYIKDMDLSKGTKLPKEEALAEELGVSRMTVRNALTELAQDGLISRRHGRGTFVNREALGIKVSLAVASEFFQMIERSGFKADVKLLGYSNVEADEDLAKKMEVEPGEKIMILEKVFLADGNPAIYCVDRWPEKLFREKLSNKDVEESIFKLLYHKEKIRIIRDLSEISTMSPDEDVRLREVFAKAKSLMVCDAINYDKNDQVVLYDTEYYDTNYIKFNISRRKEYEV